MDNFLLSIIIPAYNSGAFLSDTLNMLIHQNLDLCEVIIINDGSTDETEEICRRFSSKYPAISYITQENMGVSVARNRGLARATGRYVYFFDSDDALAVGTLSFFKSILLKNADIQIFSFGYEMRRDGNLVKKYISPKFDKKVLNSDILQESFFSKKLSCNICSCIYDRSFLENNQIFFTEGLKIGEDVEFIIKAVLNADFLYYEKKSCFIYQLRENSATAGYNFNKYTPDMFYSFELRLDLILNYTLERPYIQQILNFYIANLFLSHLVSYLRSDLISIELNEKFYLNKFLFYKPIRGLILNSIAIYIMRLVPLKCLFKIFKKN